MDKLVPKRRFKEFKDADAWEKRKLSNICSMHARIGWQNLRTSEFLDEGDYYLVTGTDFDNGKINFETCHYVKKVRFEQDKNIQLKDGNILITKDGTLGKVAIVEGLDKPATLNAGVFNIEIKEDDANNIYVYQYLKAPFLMDYVARHATGGTIKHLNQNILINFPVWMPCLEEQMRVGHFLQQLDNIITLQQRKLDKLKNMKSALLYEMFPVGNEKKPRRRLAGFTDDWEQHKLEDMLIDIIDNRGKTPPVQREGDYPMIEVASLGGQYPDYTKVTKFVTTNTFSTWFRGYLKPNDILFSTVGNTGLTSVMDNNLNAVIAQNIIGFRFKERYGALFAVQMFKQKYNFKRVKQIEMGAVQPSVKVTQLIKLYYLVPSYKEQKKIGALFKQLDDTITLQQRKVDKLKDLKKAYLNEMFV